MSRVTSQRCDERAKRMALLAMWGGFGLLGLLAMALSPGVSPENIEVLISAINVVLPAVVLAVYMTCGHVFWKRAPRVCEARVDDSSAT